MNESVKTKKTTMKKTIAGTVAAISACAVLFGGAAQLVRAAEVNQTEAIPTSYNTAAMKQTANLGQMAGYVKGNYSLKLDPAHAPTAKDVSMEAAAETGVQNIWRLFGENLDGKTIEMSYNPSNQQQPRATWSGYCKANDKQIYSFEVDAVTGQINVAQQGRHLDAKANLGFDQDLMKNPQEYVELAKAATEKYQFLTGKIVSAEYAGQGYADNDPDISISVKSETGEEIQLTFSRYDKTLTTFCSNRWVENARVLEKFAEEEMERQMAQRAKEPSANGQKSDELIAFA